MNKKISGGTKMKKKLSRVFMASMLMVTAMGLVACGKESGENGNNVNVNIESQNEEVKKEPGILKSKTEKKSGSSWVDYYEYDKNGYESKKMITDMTTGDIRLHVEYVYDENGNCLEENEIISSNSSLFAHTGYEYDEHGNITKQFFYSEDGTKGEPHRVYEYVYDQYGNMISKVEKSGNHINEYTWEITYDEAGRKLASNSKNEREEWSYYADGTLKQHISKNSFGVTTTDYDENGHEIKIVESKEYTNELISHKEFAYDDNGNMTSEKTFNVNEEYWHEAKYTYDDASNLIKKQWIKEDTILSTDEYVYNEYGRLDTIISYNKEDWYNYEIVYTYDENDNLIRESWKDEDGIFTDIEYTYY